MNLLALLSAVGHAGLVSAFGHSSAGLVHSAGGIQSRDVSGKLEDFQVYPPVLTVNPQGGLEITDGSLGGAMETVPSKYTTCQETLVTYSFGSSIGHPSVTRYTPPACAFNRVTWNMTATTQGRQYDRLGSVSFGDIELFRFSTAEPTVNGVQWTYLKDMTPFLSLMKKPQTLIFDLDNEVTKVYTAYINVTLTASYFTADDTVSPADLIVPISSKDGSQGLPSYFTVPAQEAVSDVVLPRNIQRAVVNNRSSDRRGKMVGSNENESSLNVIKFWWSNVLQSQVDAFPSAGTMPGYSPFREAELYIDGSLAGVAWLFPVIFTGGVVPGLWRPIVGIDAFDLKEDEIDITPWLPLLCDGKSHSFQIVVSGLNDTGSSGVLSETTGSNFQVDGKIFVWLDSDSSHVTTGSVSIRNTPSPDIRVSSAIYKDAAGTNQALDFSINVRRDILVSSQIQLSTGPKSVSWAQSLSFSASGNYTGEGNVTLNTFQSGGYDLSSSGYARQFSYTIYALESLTMDENVTIKANVQRGKDVNTLGTPVFPTGLETYYAGDQALSQVDRFQGASLSTHQNGTAFFTQSMKTLAASGFGTTTQDMTFSGIQVRSSPGLFGFPAVSGGRELFQRHVMAVNATVTEDQETLISRPIGRPHTGFTGPSVLSNFALSGGPGVSKVKTPRAHVLQRLLV